MISRSNTSLQPAFTANPGWDFATGIGTINVQNLVAAWPASFKSTNLSADLNK